MQLLKFLQARVQFLFSARILSDVVQKIYSPHLLYGLGFWRQVLLLHRVKNFLAKLNTSTKESLPVDLYIIADIIGLDNTIRIMEHFNYLTFNIPKNVSYPYKKQYILDNYDGTKESRFHIRKACNVCDSYIYSVMRERKEKKK